MTDTINEIDDILMPAVLVLPLEPDCTTADFYNAETGNFAFDLNVTKLGVVTAQAATEETVNSA